MSSVRLLKNTWLYRQPKKKHKSKKAARRNKTRRASDRLQILANTLNDKLPRSERWFQRLWSAHQHLFDLYNKPYGPYIPDVINLKYRYVIEIDGNIHDLPSIKLKDELKDYYFKKRGFTVFRIKAYDLKQFEETLKLVEQIRAAI